VDSTAAMNPVCNIIPVAHTLVSNITVDSTVARFLLSIFFLMHSL
jgi:hypothetical protein